MGFISHRVNRSNLEAGDHIYTWRTAFVYSHHGIYIGGDKVVHFTQDQNLSSSAHTTSTWFASSSCVPLPATCLDFPNCGVRENSSGVIMSCLNCFLGNGSLYRYEYGVSRLTLIAKFRGGTSTTAKSDPPEEVIYKAMHLLGNGFGIYNLVTNNCEDFALFCKTGLLVCGQGLEARGASGQAFSAVGVPVAAILTLPLRIFVSSRVVIGTVTAATYTLNRYSSDIGVRDDVTKVKLEDIADFQCGKGTHAAAK